MRRTLATVIGIVGLLGAARDASAFCRSTTCRSSGTKPCAVDENGCPTEGAKLFWSSSCISYAMNELGTQDLDPSETRAVIKKAFQAWSDVPCGAPGKDSALNVATMTFQEREPVSCKKSEYRKDGRNLNVILFQDDDWKYRGIGGTIAKTSVTYNDETGEIYDADIEVNAANNTVTITEDPRKIEYDLRSILTHEVGHFIGIAHSPQSSAVMFESYSPPSTAQRKLTADDVAAVCAIYPPNRSAVCNVEPRGGFSATCNPNDSSPGPCAVATAGVGAAGAVNEPAGTSAALVMVGLGLLAAARVSCRTKRSRRPS